MREPQRASERFGAPARASPPTATGRSTPAALHAASASEPSGTPARRRRRTSAGVRGSCRIGWTTRRSTRTAPTSKRAARSATCRVLPGGDGGTRFTSASAGEPRFDERGVFRGYWGVARDITDEVRAARSAQRHRGALPGAVRALAVAAGAAPRRPRARCQRRRRCSCSATRTSVRSLGQRPARPSTTPAGSRELAARLAQLETLPTGQPRCRWPTSRCARATAAACSVQRDAASASTPKAARRCCRSIVDDTERRAAEDALRRSRGAAVAPGGDQPRPDHADRPGRPAAT